MQTTEYLRLSVNNALRAQERFIDTIPQYPGGYKGRGIVICGGGVTYFTNAWVCINMLRRLGCKLPIQIWYLGPREMDKKMKALVKPLGVECVDARKMRQKNPVRTLNGWELKPYSILHSPFKEVLYLDADNVPIVNPAFLFDAPQYLQKGAVFWPDYKRLGPRRKIWDICGIEYWDEPEFESGQIVVDKEKCWKALRLTMWYNEYSDFYYNFIHGDKDTFHMAFRRMEQPYAMPRRAIEPLDSTMCQHDFKGSRIFQHRNLAKWKLLGENKRIEGFQFEKECLEHIDFLRKKWNGKITDSNFIEVTYKSKDVREAAEKLICFIHNYNRIGYDSRPMSFLRNRMIGIGADKCEQYWDLDEGSDQLTLTIHTGNDVTCILTQTDQSVWKGKWLKFEKMPVELAPVL